MKIMVAMSGGVDSSVAALLLKKSGAEIMGGTLILRKNDIAEGKHCGTDKDIADAKAVCQKLGIPFYTFDYTDEFDKEVIAKFVDTYKNGETPNPCVFCNNAVKFPAMLYEAQKLGCTHIATGHYAKVKFDQKSGRYLLIRPLDAAKDQTYVLYGLTQEILSHLILPLGDVTDKSEARAAALGAGLVNADRPDSQDICFIPSGDHADFIEKYSGEKEPSCTFVTPEGKEVTASGGISSYTVGQRKGLGIALGRPVYVVSKSAETGRVYLGDEKDLLSTAVLVGECNFIPFENLDKPMRVTAKTRYSQKEAKATITPLEDKKVLLEFDTPQRAMTAGQAAVFYDGEIVVGGGKILGKN